LKALPGGATRELQMHLVAGGYAGGGVWEGRRLGESLVQRRRGRMSLTCRWVPQ
jgi:hypothetical protein